MRVLFKALKTLFFVFLRYYYYFTHFDNQDNHITKEKTTARSLNAVYLQMKMCNNSIDRYWKLLYGK